MYRLSYSLIIDFEDRKDAFDRIGEADIAIENLARKLTKKGKCLERTLFGFCYLEDKKTWWSIAKNYAILKESEVHKKVEA